MPPHHLPLECWERSELLGSLWKHQGIAKKLEAELERRGQRDEWKWAYEIPTHEKLKSGGYALTSAFMLFESASEAYSKVPDIARKYERDPETAPYQVCKVWLPAERPALAAAASGGDVKQAPGVAPQSGPKGNAQ
jgi:hypothetical protein